MVMTSRFTLSEDRGHDSATAASYGLSIHLNVRTTQVGQTRFIQKETIQTKMGGKRARKFSLTNLQINFIGEVSFVNKNKN